MSRVVFNSANRRLLWSILYAPRPFPAPSIPESPALRIRLQRPIPTRVPHRYSSAAAAVAPVPEEEDNLAEIDAQLQGNGSPAAVPGAEALQDGSSPNDAVHGDKASESKGISVAFLPPEMLERIEKKAAQYDDEQAVKALARKERKMERVAKKERKKVEGNSNIGKREEQKEVPSSNDRSFRSEEAAIGGTSDAGKRSGNKDRWSEEQKAAVRTLKEKSKTAVAEGKEEWPKSKQKANRKNIKDWIREAQGKKKALIDSHAPRDQVFALEQAIEEAVIQGRIPKDSRTSIEQHKDSRPSREQHQNIRPPREPSEDRSKNASFASPFFSQPTQISPTIYKYPSTSPSNSSSTPPTPPTPPTSTPPNRSPHPPPPDSPSWKLQRHALQTKFSETGWQPRRKLSPDAQRGIRDLHASNPELYSTPVLAETFKISPEAIRRILRSKWMDKVAGATSTEGMSGGDALDAAGLGGRAPAGGKMQELRERWAKRYDKIWDQKSELGLLPKRTRKRRVESGEKGRRRVEEGLWRDEVLEGARREEEGLA